jgi:CubicO group peptidase (beta-lactamase class C family)
MLIGAAIEDGYIRSVDDRVGDYLPRLRDSEYADVTIENILHMASGVEWDEGLH